MLVEDVCSLTVNLGVLFVSIESSYLIAFTHSSVLAWRIRGTGEPGGLPSMGSLRVGYD